MATTRPVRRLERFAGGLLFGASVLALAACQPSADTGEETNPPVIDTGADQQVGTDGPPDLIAENIRTAPAEDLLLNMISASGGITKDGDRAEATGKIALNGPHGPINMGEGTLYFELSNGGKLANVGGSVSLPGAFAANPLWLAAPGTDRYRNEADVDASIGLMSGEQINADGRFDITLAPQREFFVFVIESDTSGAFRLDDDDPDRTSFRFDLPGDASTILIVDPMDHMVYKYASLDIYGGYGQAFSRQGLIGFEPILGDGEFAQISGHEYKNGEFGIGVKVFDIFGVKGEQLIRRIDPAAVLMNNLELDPDEMTAELDMVGARRDIQFDAAYNGELSFALSLLGADLITLKFGESSGILRAGFDQRSLDFSVRRTIDYRETEIGGENWFRDVPGVAFLPREQQTGTIRATDDTYLIELTGTYEYPIPGAVVEGTLRLTPESLVQAGLIELDGDRLEVIAEFDGAQTTTTVNLPDDSFTSDVRNRLDDAFARYDERYDSAFTALDAAIADYEFEASLRGLRTELPPILRRAKTIVEAIPATAEAQARSEAQNVIDTTCKTTNLGITKTTTCLSALPNSTERKIVEYAGSQARSEAQAEVDDAVEIIDDLLLALSQADDESLRAALKTALKEVYDNRTFEDKIVVKYNLPLGFGEKTLYSKTIKVNVLTAAQAAQVNQARDYVDLIPAASDRVVAARDYAENLPSLEAVNERRKAMMEGEVDIPSLDGAGYVYAEGIYSPFLILDGEKIETGINVMNPIDLKAAFIDAIVVGFN